MSQQTLNWQLHHTYRQLPAKFYSEGRQANFAKPEVVLFNQPLAVALGLGQADDVQALADVLVGNRFPEGSQPIAQAYAGHQFGHLGMLGDGRATLLGEQQTPSGALIDIQLKGNGRTVYSRRGDGKAAFAPMLREYLMSEAMHALGIASTRSLAVTITGEQIYRDRLQAGAVLTRTASSHIRVATFSFAAYFGALTDIRALADYVIVRHFDNLLFHEQRYLALFEHIIARQAQLLADWQLVGFIHGVMNSDNMSVAGETIDYGPCAFMDTYHPKTVFSAIDGQGRYRYENQPFMAQWNLARLAEAMLPLFSDDQQTALELAYQSLEGFMPLFKQYYLKGMANKLGLSRTTDEAVIETLSEELLLLMQKYHADFNNTFVRLTLLTAGKDGDYLEGTQALFEAAAFMSWQQKWQLKIMAREQAVIQMQRSNPCVIPRNFLVEEALAQASDGRLQSLKKLLSVLQTPFDYTADRRPYQRQKIIEGYRTFCGT